MTHTRLDKGKKGAKIGILGTFTLFIIKLLVGIIGNSTALIADAMHTMSDSASSIVVFIGFVIGEKPPDESHHFGHGDAESIAGLTVAVLIGIIGIEVARATLKRIYQGRFPVPATITLVVAFISIVFQFAMAGYIKKIGESIHSPSLLADAAHHMSDSISSGIVFISIAGAKLGYPALDPIAGFAVSLLILKLAYDVGKENINLLMGKVIDETLEKKIVNTAQGVNGVEGVHSVMIHCIGAYCSVDLHIEVDKEMKVKEADKIADKVQSQLKDDVDTVKTALVHICANKKSKAR
ncbi:MAG: cation diffusion facilitator family transporter [Candidatus Hydrothermarchaeales archaeon]